MRAYDEMTKDILTRLYDELPGGEDNRIVDGAWLFILDKQPDEYTAMVREKIELSEQVKSLESKIEDLEDELEKLKAGNA